MSKIVFFCIPAYGHTNPTLGVVRELTARGHEVRYYSYEPMRTLIEAAGAQFVACDPYDCEQHLTPADGARIGKDIAFSTHILVETTLALDEMVCADMRAYAPDCIVADSMAVWGKAVAKKLGIPFISSTTTFAFNRYSAKVMKQSGGQMLKMMLAMPKINHDLQRLRDRGYPIKNILDIIQNDDRDRHHRLHLARVPALRRHVLRQVRLRRPVHPPRDRNCRKGPRCTHLHFDGHSQQRPPPLLPRLYRRVRGLALSGHPLHRRADRPFRPRHTSRQHHRPPPRRSDRRAAKSRRLPLPLRHEQCERESLLWRAARSLPADERTGGVAARVAELGAGLKLEKADAASIRTAVDAVLQTPSYRANAQNIRESFLRAAARKQRWIKFFLSLTEDKFSATAQGND